jgi:Uncharacterised nucleotidyltransferase
MPDRNPKLRVIRALKLNPDLRGLAGMPPLESRQGSRLMRWLDQSGLALAFLKSANTRTAGLCLPEEWRVVLERRIKRNAVRLQDMLDEFQRINQAFHARGVIAITLKGFSLVPDFCEDPGLRHQTDFDFLVNPRDVDAAAEVLRSSGYTTPKLSYSEESCFTTPLQHVPSHTDDLYAIQHHRQVDLHVSLTESSPWLPLDFPGYGEDTAIPMNISGVSFCALALDTRFLVQVLHAFRHSSRSWLRLSWLLEIGHCMDLHHEDNALWTRLIEQAGNTLLMKRIFVFVLTLTQRLFGSRIPGKIANWAAEGMTPSLRVWLEHFSENWALTDWPGSLGNLFVASDFIADSRLRNEYLKSRLIPKRERLTIETRNSDNLERPFVWQIQRWKYVAHRAGVHLGDLVRFPLEQLRWQRALNSARAGLDHAQS